MKPLPEGGLTCFRPVPSAFTVKIAQGLSCPQRENTSSDPSGDQSG